MPAEPAHVEQPKHPVYALTTGELSRFRHELEHAVKGISPDAPVHADLRRKLDEVLAEQQSRESIRQASVKGSPGL
jgi:hypothetical protein